MELPQGRLQWFDAGAGPALIFVHGGFVNANVWRKIVPPLTEAGLRCVTLDLPFGSHTVPMREDADLSERGIVDLVAGAIEEIGVERATLVGMDTGGAVCQFVATQRPERVERLILTSCDYRDNFPPRLFWYLKLLPVIAPVMPLLFAPMRFRAPRRLPFAFGRLTHRQVERKVEDSWILPAHEDRRIRRDAAKMVAIFDRERLNRTADMLGDFDRPALIAWSGDDLIFPPAHGEALARELPRARFELIAGARALSMEDQPARLAELIATFMKETESGVTREEAQHV